MNRGGEERGKERGGSEEGRGEGKKGRWEREGRRREGVKKEKWKRASKYIVDTGPLTTDMLSSLRCREVVQRVSLLMNVVSVYQFTDGIQVCL